MSVGTETRARGLAGVAFVGGACSGSVGGCAWCTGVTLRDDETGEKSEGESGEETRWGQAHIGGCRVEWIGITTLSLVGVCQG